MLWKRGRAYPQELRERVMVAADEGGRVGQIARRFKVSASYVSKVLSRRAKTGETAARPQVNHVLTKLAAHQAALRAKVQADPDLTLAELQAWVVKDSGGYHPGGRDNTS
jgi:transposase